MVNTDKLYRSFLKKDAKNDNKCSYKIRQTKTQRSIIFMCSICENSSTLNDQNCRKQILSALLREPLVERIVLSHLYERDYEGKEIKALYELAHLQETLSNYINPNLSFNCHQAATDKCCSDRIKMIKTIIATSKNDLFR